ncbi:hypothetical protein W02_31920 [Nitrospira sp. KM1]|uniref:response regulator n=1 Tax=Nitrospira sp. KM1 TaxID=1936990 RepID=UPI0013A73096|nr:response regulator transcription factor [Nitrospira sp. KM1]BCA56052.1 hypothetical protein W02_31920 [Nitrospira sp. KM1]
MISDGLSVLFIDGHDRDRRAFTDLLRLCSPVYRISEATDGQSGLDFFYTRPIDCVVLELDLPDGSGFEVLKTLLPDASNQDVAVVVLTHLMSEPLFESALKLGAQEALLKRRTSANILDRAVAKAIANTLSAPHAWTGHICGPAQSHRSRVSTT